MPRHFNTAGPCRPEDHYMLPPEDRLPGVRSLIAEKAYFVIHAPRQTGKTTCFRTLARSLDAEGEYAAVHAAVTHLATECYDDLVKHCSELEMGEGRVASCLLDHKGEVTEACRKAIDDTGLEAE